MPVKAAVFAISFIASCGTVAVAGLLAAGLQNWFGVSDLTFLVVWFVPLKASSPPLWLRSRSREPPDGRCSSDTSAVLAWAFS